MNKRAAILRARELLQKRNAPVLSFSWLILDEDETTPDDTPSETFVIHLSRERKQA